MSIQESLDARDERYLALVVGRKKGVSDATIAQRVVGVASPRDLYERIKEDGHPICSKCGKTYVDETHCKTPSETPRNRSKPKAKTFGEKKRRCRRQRRRYRYSEAPLNCLPKSSKNYVGSRRSTSKASVLYAKV